MTESFSTRLNDAMALRELKQIDFVHAAEKFNIKLGKSHMSQYVSGKTVPRADIAHFLAAYLRVNEDWLMGKDVPMEAHAAILPDIAGEQPDHVDDASEQPTEGRTMRTFTKSHKLDNVLYDVRGPVADEAARMEAACIATIEGGTMTKDLALLWQGQTPPVVNSEEFLRAVRATFETLEQ